MMKKIFENKRQKQNKKTMKRRRDEDYEAEEEEKVKRKHPTKKQIKYYTAYRLKMMNHQNQKRQRDDKEMRQVGEQNVPPKMES